MENYHVYDQLSCAGGVTTYKARRKKSVEYVTVLSHKKDLLPQIRNAVHMWHSLQHPNVLRFQLVRDPTTYGSCRSSPRGVPSASSAIRTRRAARAPRPPRGRTAST